MYIALIIIGGLLTIIGIIRIIRDFTTAQKVNKKTSDWDISTNSGENRTAYSHSNHRHNRTAASIPEATDGPVTSASINYSQEASHTSSSHLQGAYVPPVLPVPDTEEESEELTNKEKGNQFENYVANCFKNRNIFSVLEWHQGATSSEGVYGMNCLNPDFKIRHRFNDNFHVVYWVECKYRSSPTIIFNEYQLKRYLKIQHDTRLKVIIIIGTGGSPNAPEDVFVVPLDSVNRNVMSAEQLQSFRLPEPHTAFESHIKNYFYTQVFRKTRPQ